jgi:hypothetical protein
MHAAAPTMPATAASILALQRAAGNGAVVSGLRPSEATLSPLSPFVHVPTASAAVVQRNGDFDVPTLAQAYETSVRSARQTGDWQRAAELLNGFNHVDIQARLADLTEADVGALHRGALANPAVGGGSNVARLTAPGVPPTSTMPPTSNLRGETSSAPDRAGDAPDRDIASMSPTDKLLAAYERAQLAPAFRDKVRSLITPEALVAAIVGFVAAFAVSQLTPVGWAADIGIFFTAVFVASSLFSAIQHLINFAAARNATSPEDVDRAGSEFAAAVAEVSVDTIVLVVTHRLAGGVGGSGQPPPTAAAMVRMGVTPEGLVVPVLAHTVPAAVPVMTSVAVGVRGAAAAPALMSAMSGGQGPGGSGGSGGSRAPQSRSAEQTFLDRLRERFPRLRQLDIRPKARPSASGYTSRTPSPEVGGGTEFRREVSGAPEHAFEERMRTSQGGYSYTVYDGGKAVIELDGISVEGWIDEIKIEQQLTGVEEIVAQLRVQADFAEAYGLRGVHYSIAPPAVADAVEARIAEERLLNVFRVE